MNSFTTLYEDIKYLTKYKEYTTINLVQHKNNQTLKQTLELSVAQWNDEYSTFNHVSFVLPEELLLKIMEVYSDNKELLNE